jgi:hypothetical protein
MAGQVSNLAQDERPTRVLTVCLSSECSFDERSRRILHKTAFSYFCSVAAPDAGPEELRTVCDWGNWVFPFDDSTFFVLFVDRVLSVSGSVRQRRPEGRSCTGSAAHR